MNPSRLLTPVRSLTGSLRLLSWIGLALLVLGAALIYYYPSHDGADLIPDPDATEYAVVALNLLHGKGLTFTVNGALYPSRYPFGFSLILSAFYLVSGQFLGHAIYVVYLSAIGSVVVVYLLMRKLTGPGPALFAGATIFTSVLFRNWSQSVLSDHTSVLLFCLLSLCTYYLFAKKTLRILLAIAYVIVCTLMIWLRFIDIVIVFANMALLGYAIKRKYIDIRYTIPIVVALAAGLIPTFIYNAITFGGITETGYSYWVPSYFKNTHNALAFKYFLHSHISAGSPFGPNYQFYTTALVGRGTYFPSFILVLALIGVLTFLVRFRRYSIEKRMTLAFVALGWCFYVGTYALYFWQADRFLIPAVPMVGIFVGVCFHEYFLKWFGAWRRPLQPTNTLRVSLPKVGIFLRICVREATLRIARATATVVVSLVLALLTILSGVQAYRTVVRPSYAYREILQNTHGIYGIRYDTYLAMNLHCQNGCVIVSLDDPAFVNYIVPNAYIVNASNPFYEQSSEGPTANNQGNARYDKVRDAVNGHVPVLYDGRLVGFIPNARTEMLRFGDETLVESSRLYNVYQLVPRTSR